MCIQTQRAHIFGGNSIILPLRFGRLCSGVDREQTHATKDNDELTKLEERNDSMQARRRNSFNLCDLREEISTTTTKSSSRTKYRRHLEEFAFSLVEKNNFHPTPHHFHPTPLHFPANLAFHCPKTSTASVWCLSLFASLLRTNSDVFSISRIWFRKI